MSMAYKFQQEELNEQRALKAFHSIRSFFMAWRVANWQTNTLIGEQGIGDSMMFATLIPKLQDEGMITLLPGIS